MLLFDEAGSILSGLLLAIDYEAINEAQWEFLVSCSGGAETPIIKPRPELYMADWENEEF
jgi:hypothetical protein